MPTRQVHIVGLMTWDEPSAGVPTPPIYYPPGIWGPTDPRPGWGLPGPPPVISGPPGPWPSPPIHLPAPPPIISGPPGPWPSPPIHLPPTAPPGAHPMPPIYYPPGIWGPTDPRPGLGPVPPQPGIGGPPGPWPSPPIHLPPQQPPSGGTPLPPAAGVPIDGKLVWIPGYGWTFIPAGAGAPAPPDGPTVPPQPPTGPPQPPGVTNPIQPTVPEPKK